MFQLTIPPHSQPAPHSLHPALSTTALQPLNQHTSNIVRSCNGPQPHLTTDPDLIPTSYIFNVRSNLNHPNVIKALISLTALETLTPGNNGVEFTLHHATIVARFSKILETSPDPEYAQIVDSAVKGLKRFARRLGLVEIYRDGKNAWVSPATKEEIEKEKEAARALEAELFGESPEQKELPTSEESPDTYREDMIKEIEYELAKGTEALKRAKILDQSSFPTKEIKKAIYTVDRCTVMMAKVFQDTDLDSD